jgi:alpha-beta hydrolase superfamily lysophospholipase
VQKAFASDPLTFDAQAAKLFGLLDGARLLGTPKKLARDLPIHIVIGSEDSLGGEKSIARLAAAYVKRSGLTDVQAIVYPEARHEIFNETNRDEVLGDAMTFIHDHV